MPGSADRIQVELRCEDSDVDRIKKVLDDIGDVLGEDGRSINVELVTNRDVTPDSPLVVVGPDDEGEMLAAVDDGAMGYVTASSDAAELEQALATVAGGAAVIPPMMLGALLRHTVQRRRTLAEAEERLSALTERERQVVEHLASGRQRREIAQTLVISPETVRTHIQRAMAKLGVHSQTELMALLAPLQQGRP